MRKSLLNECVIAHGIFGDKVILAKNRDRSYTAKIKVVREYIPESDLEIVYILDDDTDWSEGMNCHGIGIINSALMVSADENEKKLAKKSGKVSEDGLKIRKALSHTKPSEAILSIINFTGEDKANVGVKGHTFIATAKHSYSIESTSKHVPIIKKLNRNFNHVRTNHGYDYTDSGYTTGANKVSSHKRHTLALNALNKIDNQSDVLGALSSRLAKDMRNNPYRDLDKVENPTKKDLLSTTGQVMMNLTDLIFTVHIDKDKGEFLGIENRNLPKDYQKRIKILIKK